MPEPCTLYRQRIKRGLYRAFDVGHGFTAAFCLEVPTMRLRVDWAPHMPVKGDERLKCHAAYISARFQYAAWVFSLIGFEMHFISLTELPPAGVPIAGIFNVPPPTKH